MLWPWQIISKIFSLNFTYKINFDFDHKKILKEYNEAKNKLSNINHPSIGIDHDGGWEVVALYSQTGDAVNVKKIADVNTKPTEIVKYFSYTNEVIKELLKKYDCKPRRIRFSILKAQKKSIGIMTGMSQLNIIIVGFIFLLLLIKKLLVTYVTKVISGCLENYFMEIIPSRTRLKIMVY